jgi:hypothetical protein
VWLRTQHYLLELDTRNLAPGEQQFPVYIIKQGTEILPRIPCPLTGRA